MRQHFYFTVIWVIQIILFQLLTVEGQNRYVKTRLGSLKGWTGLSRSGRDYAAFTGIPYAKPPIDSLRFQNPVEFGSWKDEYDATDNPPFCPQTTIFGEFVGSEDCLYLNIYTPKVGTEKLPVLLYIHGGAFKFGHPGPRNMASYLMDEDVILVTTSYRVGVMGFLSLEDSTVPGNFGLKDQALALKWVKKNIDSFGGDSNTITLIGESAGAASVHHLMLSPLTRDLMKGGISMSGTVNRVWSMAWTKGLIRGRTIKIAKHLGCRIVSEMLTCLQRLDLKDIATADAMLANEDSIPFKPAIEPKGPGAFIPDDPLKAPSSKPWMTSFANGEFLLGTLEMGTETKELIIDNNIDVFLSNFLQRRGVSKDLFSKVRKLKDRYITGHDKTEFVIQVAKCWGNMSFVYTALDNLEKHIGPKFVYHQEFKGERSLLDLASRTSLPYAGHADELIYLFDYSSLLNYKLNDKDVEFSKDLIWFVVNFARNQVPVANDSPMKWKPWNGKEIMRLTVDGHFMADEDFCRDKSETRDFWKDIFYDEYTKDEL